MASEPASASLLSPTDRPPAFVRHLARLPPGMLEQVMNDLPIIRALQILCFGTQTLKKSVLNHQQYRQLFLSQADAAPTMDLFRLYRDVCWFRRLPLANQWSHLSNVYRHVQRRWGNQTDDLRRVETELKGTILTELRLSDVDEAILSAHSSKPCPKLDQNNLSALKLRWDWIKQGKLMLNAKKAEQINMVADVIADYPGRVRLKKPLDPSQDGPRPNTQHIINGFRGAATRVLKDRHINHYYKASCCKGVECIEVIPYDNNLSLFLDTLKKYPVANEYQSVEGLMGKLALDDATVAKSFHYPDEIAAALSIVMEGLANVYTSSPLLIVPRIDWNPPTSESSDSPTPIFLVDTKPHPPDLPSDIHRCPVRKVMAYDEREYEWLRAFLKVVTWMEDNLSGKEKQASSHPT